MAGGRWPAPTVSQRGGGPPRRSSGPAFSKRLEQSLKNGATAILTALVKHPARQPPPPYERILFIRYGGIGDMILSLPVFRAARAGHPQAQIDVLCARKNMSPLIGTNLADHIDVYEKQPQRVVRTIMRLRRRRYDYICNLVAYPSFTFGALARLIGPEALCAAGDQERFSRFYDRLIELPPKRQAHMLDRLFLLAADVTGTHAGPGPPPWVEYGPEIKEQAAGLFAGIQVQLGLRSHPPRVAVVNLAAGLRRREWPLERYAELLRVAIPKHRNSIEGWVLVTSPERAREADQLVALISDCSVTVLPPVPDFRVLMEFLRHIRLLVTPDTSLAHAASAMGTPVLDLIIGENAITWRPVGVPHRLVVSRDPLSLREVPVSEVEAGLDDLIGEIT